MQISTLQQFKEKRDEIKLIRAYYYDVHNAPARGDEIKDLEKFFKPGFVLYVLMSDVITVEFKKTDPAYSITFSYFTRNGTVTFSDSNQKSGNDSVSMLQGFLDFMEANTRNFPKSTLVIQEILRRIEERDESKFVVEDSVLK